MDKVEHIPDDEYVLRRIYPANHNDGELDSTAFDDKNDEPSVHWEKIAGIDKIQEKFDELDFCVRLRVGDIRQRGHEVIHQPDEDTGDESHCVIIPSGGKLSRGTKRSLAGKGADPIPGERVYPRPNAKNGK